MPFSSTASCSEEDWTRIFEHLIKPAVEEAGLGYECRRSSADRGNIIAQIMESLRDAHVVIADLTDQNPNVFYELGVRHSLANRTILIAQDRNAIPFDLRPYANHVYNWKTEEVRTEFAARIGRLLEEIHQSPDRADNPVSDFLGSRPRQPQIPDTLAGIPNQAQLAQTLVGPSSEGVNAKELARTIARSGDPAALRSVIRLARSFFLAEWPRRIELLDSQPRPERAVEAEIYARCLPLIDTFAVDIYLLEEFGLVLVEAGYTEGLVELLRIAEDWISLSDRAWPGTSYRPVRGAPALLALRVLASWSAKGVDQGSLAILRVLLTSPLQTVDASGQVSSRPLVDRGDLFYAEGLLGYANLTVTYLSQASWEHKGLREMFATREDYLSGLAVFLFLTDFLFVARNAGREFRIYPAYRLVEGSTEALHRFVARLPESSDQLEELASMTGESLGDFRKNWAERVRTLNDARLDHLGDWLTGRRFQPLPENL